MFYLCFAMCGFPHIKQVYILQTEVLGDEALGFSKFWSDTVNTSTKQTGFLHLGWEFPNQIHDLYQGKGCRLH